MDGEKKMREPSMASREMYHLIVPSRINKKIAFLKARLADLYPEMVETPRIGEAMDSFLLVILSLSERYDEVHTSDSAQEDH